MYLQQLPKNIPVFVELRHERWFSDKNWQEKVFAMFRSLNICTVITDVASRRDAAHLYLPTPSAFIRFVGSSLHPAINHQHADAWVKRIKSWQQQGLKALYLLVHLQQTPGETKLADYFIDKLTLELGLDLKRPRFIEKPLELF